MEPESPAQVPYTAYRNVQSKRHSHSRNLSNNYSPRPSISSPPTSRRPSIIGSPGNEKAALYRELPPSPPMKDASITINGHDAAAPPPVTIVLPSEESSPRTPSPVELTEPIPPPPLKAEPSVNGEEKPQQHVSRNGKEPALIPFPDSPQPTLASQPRQSTFRRITPARAARAPLPSSPLRPTDSPSTRSRTLSSASTASTQSHAAIARRPAETRSRFDPLPAIPSELHQPIPSHHSTNSTSSQVFTSPTPTPVSSPPPPRHSSLPVKSPAPIASPSPYASPVPPNTSPVLSPVSSVLPTPPKSPATPPSTRVPASQRTIYRPGFQPKGVYRPRTDEFLALRKHKLDVGRIERTKLERRFEKLIDLHFPVGGQKPAAVQKPTVEPRTRRQSFFEIDFEALRNVDAGGLLKGVLQGEKGTVRAAEQRITPWQEDSSVSKCPLCETSFHPITNRKHHCRLCGQIICSLPIRRPQRPAPCSTLFIVNSESRRIEEVSEGVDYGVRRKRPGSLGGNEKVQDMWDEEKFLKGVRICRECKPVMLRQQYRQDFHQVPVSARLHEAFVSLEKEIEDSLPQFQELVLSLSQDDQPTKEASATRKRILELFTQYDALAKRIRKLPCPNGPGSSQDRVQQAIQARANIFLEKHMVPLQSLPTPKHKRASTSKAAPDAPDIDPDSKLAQALQPLLEQEALLESFVEEANTHRRFEDAKTLKANLAEIRAEIKRIADGEGVR